MYLPKFLSILTIFCLIHPGIMAWDYNEEQKAEIVELRGKGERVEDIDWSKPMLADEKDLKEMFETFTPVLGRASVDEMLQAFKDFKTLMSQEDFDRMFDGQRLFREIMVRSFLG
jgi:hypothetical protein